MDTDLGENIDEARLELAKSCNMTETNQKEKTSYEMQAEFKNSGGLSVCYCPQILNSWMKHFNYLIISKTVKKTKQG